MITAADFDSLNSHFLMVKPSAVFFNDVNDGAHYVANEKTGLNGNFNHLAGEKEQLQYGPFKKMREWLKSQKELFLLSQIAHVEKLNEVSTKNFADPQQLVEEVAETAKLHLTI